MIIKKILLQNFRCYDDEKIDFLPGLNIITGPNASGKTTILESISCLSVIKSYRCFDQNELIKYQKSFFFIEGIVENVNKSSKISLYGDSKGRNVKCNNYKFHRLSEYLGFFNVVIFSATDFLMLNGTPKERRKLFDLIICQISKDFINASNNYKKLLKQRNALLKRLIFENNSKLDVLLDVVTEQLINEGKKIVTIRKKVISELSKFACERHLKISDGKEQFRIEYIPSADVSNYQIMMENSKSEDLKKGITTIGPHRDDYIFIINNKNIASFGSQGQQRNALLSTKLAMADFIYEIKKDSPIVLLDDVFSELDVFRQNSLVDCLRDEFQTIITTATMTDLNSKILEKANIIKIDRRSE